jgi:DNA-binding IclR family transcriptional regulator
MVLDAVLLLMCAAGTGNTASWTTTELAALIGMDRRHAGRGLERLIACGVLRCMGRAGRWRREYALTPTLACAAPFEAVPTPGEVLRDPPPHPRTQSRR